MQPRAEGLFVGLLPCQFIIMPARSGNCADGQDGLPCLGRAQRASLLPASAKASLLRSVSCWVRQLNLRSSPARPAEHAVLCCGGAAQALELTQDQTADREDERERIAAVGGMLRHVMGSWRVGEAGMQVTR